MLVARARVLPHVDEQLHAGATEQLDERQQLVVGVAYRQDLLGRRDGASSHLTRLTAS